MRKSQQVLAALHTPIACTCAVTVQGTPVRQFTDTNANETNPITNRLDGDAERGWAMDF